MVITSEEDFAEKIKTFKKRIASLKPSDNGSVYKKLQKDLTELRDANILFWRNQGISIKTLATSNHLTQGRICQIISQEKKNVIKGKQKMITFEKDVLEKFVHRNKAITWAEAFYKQHRLDKTTHPQDKEFCERLRFSSEEKAKQMIRSRMIE